MFEQMTYICKITESIWILVYQKQYSSKYILINVNKSLIENINLMVNGVLRS